MAVAGDADGLDIAPVSSGPSVEGGTAHALWGPSGDPETAALFCDLYDELRRLARSKLARMSGLSDLDGTEIVHLAFERLWSRGLGHPNDRGQLFGTFATVICRVLVDEVRARQAARRGGRLDRVPLVELQSQDGILRVDVLALNEALEELEALDADVHRVVMIRIFASRTAAQVAEVLGLSPAEERGRWEYGKAWIHERLSRDGAAPGDRGVRERRRRGRNPGDSGAAGASESDLIR